ncbi:hypothetical protein DYB32_009467 [Aphanomyces invadans]|uniref:Uncharacterized protein n=1 Tax=Aphanomyces invadans TaxID=157072 RepID=A0A3R6Y1G5_9STRA|nr:hypothetical protein DYB32_009467 [Aphanomyces invadans]
MTTATLVSFKDKERLLGEAAVLASSTNPTNTVDYVNLLLGKTFDQVMHQLQAFPCQRSNFKANDAGLPVASVEYNGSTVEFSPVQLMAMLLAKIGGNVASDRSSLKVGVAIPPGWSAAEQTALLQAIKIAGFGAASLVYRDVALARCYHQKHPVKDEAAAKTIAIVDVGHVSTTAALVRFSATGETILARAYDGALGSANYDRHLYTHFEAKLKASHGVQIQPESRQSRRLLLACEQLKKLLSTIPDAVVHVENVVPDADITLSMTKTELEQLGHVETTAIRELMEGLFAQTDVAPADIATVEIVGGGTRMPLVQDAITKAIGAHVTLGRMLDSATAVAVGAALSDEVGMFFDVSVHDGDVALEKSMQDLDHNMTMLANKRNEIETFVYDMRAKQGQKHGHLIDSAVVAPLLDAAEDWFYSDEAATLEEATVRVDQFKTVHPSRRRHDALTRSQDIRNACQAYFAAVEKDEKELEHQLEVEAQKAALENKDDDDHDFRKALTHATKFFDLRPDEAAEVKAIKLSLYLNVAQCYLKLESWQKAVVNCKDALDLDPTNTKALYRRALGYERLKDYAAAFEDSQKAFMLAPGDKAVVALNDRLKAHMKKQEATEKKMWAKAFA